MFRFALLRNATFNVYAFLCHGACSIITYVRILSQPCQPLDDEVDPTLPSLPAGAEPSKSNDRRSQSEAISIRGSPRSGSSVGGFPSTTVSRRHRRCGTGALRVSRRERRIVVVVVGWSVRFLDCNHYRGISRSLRAARFHARRCNDGVTTRASMLHLVFVCN